MLALALALALAVSLCHNCAASSFLTTRRLFLPRVAFLPRVVLLSHHALLVIASRVSQTHVGIYNTETQSLTDDNRAAVMNVGVGGVALPLLQRRVLFFQSVMFNCLC